MTVVKKRKNLEAISQMILEKFEKNYFSLLPNLEYVDERMGALVQMEQALFDKAMSKTIDDMVRVYELLKESK